MSENERNIESHHRKDQNPDDPNSNIAASVSGVSSVAGSVKQYKQQASSSERQIKFEKAQKCLENAVLVSKRIKEHRKATAELLGRPFEEDVPDTASEVGTAVSEKTGYSVSTEASTLSVQDALNIPGISESLANTLKQKEILMERIKQYKEINKRPMKKATPTPTRGLSGDTVDKKTSDGADVSKLMNLVKEKENNLSVMQVKMKAMENTILDLQEKITEKDQIIEAKNRATTLISDSLSKKERETLDLLEDTKEQMTKMQSNFIAMETEWKEEKQKLLNELNEKNSTIKSLEEANTILENARFEIGIDNSKLSQELEIKTKEIVDLQEKLQQLSQTTEEPKESKEVLEEKGSIEVNDMEELTKKIELLEQINFEIRQTNKELESQLATFTVETKPVVSPTKRGSPLPTRKGGRNTASKMKSPWSQLSSESLPQEQDKKSKPDKTKSDTLLQSLNKEILDKEYVISEKNIQISELQNIIQQKERRINELESIEVKIPEKADASITTDTIEIVKDDDSEPILTLSELKQKLKSAEDSISSLNAEIDASNKNMIKVKSNSKLKVKQMQKTIDNFSKVSDASAEIVKLNEEIHHLTQKVAELEEEKGNLQLHLVDYDSGRLTESDVYKKLIEMENVAEARLKSISLLETQKFDLVQELHSLQQKNLEMEDKLADISQLQSEQVSSEMKSVQLEEQIDNLLACKKELELIIENLKLDKDQLSVTIKSLQEEKDELTQKLENYIQENIELADKLGKLSAEKVSSAESIEIVESLTSQEKLELEEYSKGLQTEQKTQDGEYKTPDKHANETSKEKLLEEIIELKNRIELFTVERQEVMERMSKLSIDNESLNENITELKEQCDTLKRTIDTLEKEKNQLVTVNEGLNRQLEELKHEKSEILKETADVVKSSATDDVTDAILAEASHQDDKTAGDKGARNKSVKQLTKEILKLKNTIKEREEDIADCQMKILSLEEQQEKNKEILQSHNAIEKLAKKLTEENNDLRKEIENINKDNKVEQQQNISQAHEMMQIEAQKLHQEYNAAINARDTRIHELENVLMEYEKQVINYGNTLQQKDKELSEYINQITKLNDVSQKLKSTIDLLEEEKAKDQNSEVIKSLNKQIGLYQKTLADYEDKLRISDEEKNQLVSLKTKFENKNSTLESELKKVQDVLTEKQTVLQDLQAQQSKHSEELANAQLQAKERDEEIHEIKLQLRKESIDNEKLHNIVVQKSNEINEITKMYEGVKETLSSVSADKSQGEQIAALEAKNKELMDKLKKFAASIKKKSAMYTELENQLHETQKQLQAKNELYEQLLIQVETIPALQEKLKHAEEEFNRFQHLKISMEQMSQELLVLQSDNEMLKNNAFNDKAIIAKLNESIDLLNRDLYMLREENKNFKVHIESLNNKMVECEIDQKNYTNLVTKISCLESELSQKQSHITELSNQVEIQNEKFNQVQYGQDAKVQEREMYIENLQCEIDKYKNRIERLEQCISSMESSRQSLERKADDLGSQLHDKRKAYDEYMNQEDELVSRLAVLMDHDRVVEKQLREIESENKELRSRGQNLTEEFHSLKSSYQALQEKCSTLQIKANNAETLESELSMYQNNCRQLDIDLKRITSEHEHLLGQKKRDIEELESDFNTQIEHSIKEKKLLSEKYEKIVEHVTQLESKLEEYRNTIEHLNVNVRELEAENQNLIQKFSSQDKTSTPDYTEQYISEINRLNSLLNNKNQEISDINNSKQLMQTNNLSQVSALESKNTDLSQLYESLLKQVNSLNSEIETLKDDINNLHVTITQKDEQIKQLKEKKRVTFEMNIPKTEGLTISSTIEEMDYGQASIDMSSLQSQIVSDIEPLQHNDKVVVKRNVESVQQHSASHSSGEGSIEPPITPKKSYLCYKEEEVAEIPESDPFNSDEGWGFSTQEVTEDVIPGFSHLNQQIQELKTANENLKSELKTTNSKLLKALKKLKELKAANDVLSNDLKISKQISQSSILDMAIEGELSSNLKMLETKVERLSNQLNDEKRDTESVKKQNEVLRQTNERLLETKETLENELESWKVNFRQVSGKLSMVQWGGDNTNTEVSTVAQSGSRPISNINPDLEGEIDKLEKENDELQSVIDSLNTQNKDLAIEQTHLKEEIHRLIVQIQEQKQLCDNYETLKTQLEEIQNTNKSLELANTELKDNVNNIEVLYNEAKVNYETLKTSFEEKELSFKNVEGEFLDKNVKLTEELKSLHQFEDQANSTILELNSELEELRSQLLLAKEKQEQQTTPEVNSLLLSEKYNSMEQHCLDLKTTLEETLIKLQQQQQGNKILQDKIVEYEEKVSDLNSKLENLSLENNQQQCLHLKNTDDETFNKLQLQEQENMILQDKIKEYERQVNDLTMNLQNVLSESNQQYCLELKNAVSDAISKLQMQEQENTVLQDKIKEYEVQVNELTIKFQNLNSENDQLLSTVTELRSSISSAMDQRGFEIAELWKQHLAQREGEFQKIEQDLRIQLGAAESKYEQLLENVQSSSQEETNKIIMMEQINSLQNKLLEKEDHLLSIQNKYAEAINQLDMLRSEMDDEKVMSENKLFVIQEDNERIVKELNKKHEEECQDLTSQLSALQTELDATKRVNTELGQQVQELHNNYKSQITEISKQLQFKESEIYQKTHDFTINLKQRNDEFETVRQQLIEYEKKLEDTIYEKESELAIFRLKLHERTESYEKMNKDLETERNSLAESLNEKIIECTNLSKQITDLNKVIEEYANKAAETQLVLESQELEIVTLKSELSELNDAFRLTKNKIEKHVTFASDTKQGQEIETPQSERDPLHSVPRAELDLALYMLHQRDVRCEELTMELTQLLEERDTLQLRLSDSIRSYEELKSRYGPALDASVSSSHDSVSELPSFSVEKERQFVDTHRGQSSRSSSISDPDGEKPKLQAKLSELRTVRHSRDVRLRQDSEHRQLDMRLLQRDVASLPAEAVERLAQAHHTLSRDSQSTPTVLLNWLRGKSTPKVVHM